MDKLSQEQVELVVKTMADTAIKNEEYFSQLDGVMGDADFGTSLASGFRALMAGRDGFDKSSAGAFLLACSSAITSNTGGCSGPVWGTLFMRGGMALRGKTEVALADLAPALKSAIEGIQKRGGAEMGDKTLLDSLNAILVSFEASMAAGDDLKAALAKAAAAADAVKETAKEWVAKRGRQSFTGDRSKGTYDPGMVAVAEMCKAIVEALG